MRTTSHHLEVARIKLDLAERLIREAQQHLRDGAMRHMLPKKAANNIDISIHKLATDCKTVEESI